VSLELRPYQDADLDWLVPLRYRWYPEVMPENEIRMALARPVPSGAVRVVVELDGIPVGYAAVIPPTFDEGSDSVLILVEESSRGRGVGSRLFKAVEPHLGIRGLPGDRAVPERDGDPSVEIAGHWGFRVLDRAVASRLFLGEPALPLARAGESVRVVDDVDLTAVVPDVDAIIDGSNTSPERAAGFIVTHELLSDWWPGLVWVVVSVSSEPCALACACPHDGDSWHVIYTGVLPGQRGRGLARLAKQHLHAEVARRGGREVWTENESGNAGILALNSSFGYSPFRTELRLRREPGVRASS